MSALSQSSEVSIPDPRNLQKIARMNQACATCINADPIKSTFELITPESTVSPVTGQDVVKFHHHMIKPRTHLNCIVLGEPVRKTGQCDQHDSGMPAKQR